MSPQADIPINVDSKSFKITEDNMKNPDRWPQTLKSLANFLQRNKPFLFNVVSVILAHIFGIVTRWGDIFSGHSPSKSICQNAYVFAM